MACSILGARSKQYWLGAVLTLAVTISASSAPADDGDLQPSVDEILRHLRILGDDAMEGRGTGTAGGKRAAAYIEEQLTALGLEPLGADGSYRQPIPLHGSLPLPGSRLTLVDSAGDEHSLKLWDDYVLFGSGAQTFLPRPVPMEFVAYGIVAPEYDYNDYQRTEVADRIVVVLAGEPPSNDPDFFDGLRPTVYSDPEMKFRTALARGARGVILIPTPWDGNFIDWQRTLDLFQTEDVALPYGIAGSLDLLLRFERAPKLFVGAESSFAELIKRAGEGTLTSFPLKTQASFEGAFRERDFTADNLIARLPGSDPLLQHDHVVVCAHYDHLGIGRPVNGDAIYNGVVDNASGTAAVLELARVLASTPRRPRRSIIFLFVTGEEKGLLGSRYYVDHPAVPLHRTVAAINVDGLSVLGVSKRFVGIGSRFSTLGELLEETLARRGLERVDIPQLFADRKPFFHSDQLAFAQAGVPAVLVMEGFPPSRTDAPAMRRFIAWGRDRYHTPFDDLQQPLDRGAIEQHAAVLLAFVDDVADTSTEPRWLPGAPWIAARLRTMAEGR